VSEADLQLRVMQLGDIAVVSAMERGAYTEHWPATNFERELTANPVARYVVLTHAGQVVGFAGLWVQVDEGHVVNVVVPTEERGKGYGKLLIHALLNIAIDLQLTLATLEVRSSNAVARALYRDYGFWEVGERKRYYSDGEDALIMTTDDLDSPAFLGRFERNRIKLEERFPGTKTEMPSGD
jgi:[ribosomal protein S18]-alanine N-acetyltransferase